MRSANKIFNYFKLIKNELWVGFGASIFHCNGSIQLPCYWVLLHYINFNL